MLSKIIVLFWIAILFWIDCDAKRHRSNKFTINHSNSSSRIDCENRNQFDLNMAKLMTIGENGRDYPENFDDLKLFCRESKKLIHNVDKYKNLCFHGQWKQFVSIFIYSNRNAIKKFCTKSNENSKKLLQTSKCINSNRKPINRCLSILTEEIESIRWIKSGIQKIPLLCCKYHKFHDCFMNVLEDDEQCQSKIDTISEFLRLVLGNLIENNCGEYNNESDRCSRIDSIIEKPSNRTIPNDQNRSIMYAIYNVLDS
ncbi:hypothetical protein SSS_07826 [Sarcoptes scabiei]|uniref:Uncharacterized protein n=1 Tax=Sarcoptes scabiei TaxID=52283 RepID=A0A834R8H8_SARSC|nr:hypothetical protein SSS_07826 [Sarcoptes scabiei]UXI14221.1 secreted salivary gland peptide [Sarcoptes scabiei]